MCSFLFHHKRSCRVQLRSPWRQAHPSDGCRLGPGGGLQSALDRSARFLLQLFCISHAHCLFLSNHSSSGLPDQKFCLEAVEGSGNRTIPFLWTPPVEVV